jgi:hypothetical protein
LLGKGAVRAGLGLVVLHNAGAATIRLDGHVSYDPRLVAVSVWVVRVRLDGNVTVSDGVPLSTPLVPICRVATLVMTALAYNTVSVSVRQETDRRGAPVPRAPRTVWRVPIRL